MAKKKITTNSIEFKNFKEVVDRNKLKDNGTNIDTMVSYLKKKEIKL